MTIKQLEVEVERLKVRQDMTDRSILLLIRTWQPFLLSVGEAIVSMSKGSGLIRSPVLKRLRKGMGAIREMLPAISDQADKDQQ